VHAGDEDHTRRGWTTSTRGQDSHLRISQNDRGRREMEKVRPWCGQPSDRRRLKNRTEHVTMLSVKALCLSVVCLPRLFVRTDIVTVP